MARLTGEETKGVLMSSVRGSPLGELAFGLLPLGLWGYLALCLLRAVTVPAPMAIAADAGELSAPAPQQVSALETR
jgi:hypothetical protein